jgi:hypothetical protein
MSWRRKRFASMSIHGGECWAFDRPLAGRTLGCATACRARAMLARWIDVPYERGVQCAGINHKASSELSARRRPIPEIWKAIETKDLWVGRCGST